MHTRIVKHAISINYEEMLTQQHEWRSDYPWFIKRIEGHRVLDLGYKAHAFFTMILLEYGFEVVGVDRAEATSEADVRGELFKHITADVREIPEPTSSFSTIIAPSLLEHVGLGFYGENQVNDSRIKAMGEWHRLLKEGGLLLAQLPYGKNPRIINFQGRPYYQTYTSDMIARDFGRFAIEDIAYHSYEPHGWIEVSKAVADHMDHTTPFPPCLVKIMARKQRDDY